jgi:hypothetical protein
MKSPCCGLHLFSIGTILLLFRKCIILGPPPLTRRNCVATISNSNLLNARAAFYLGFE